MASRSLRCALLAVVLIVGAVQARAQCQASWIPTFGERPGVDGAVNAMTVFNDGSGSALYLGGGFIHGGANLTPLLAKWDGSTWSAMGSPMLGIVYALTVFDDGGGPALYAGGSFGVAKRTGTSWSYVGNLNGTASALAVFDDGQGKHLYAGGAFANGTGTGYYHDIAKWDGSSWIPLGFGFDRQVRSLAVFDDGSGEELYAGGDFTLSGTIPFNHIAKWDGYSWHALGSGASDKVNTLTVHDDGSGAALYVGGLFSTVGGLAAHHVAKWSSLGWSPLAGGPNGEVHALSVFNDGSGRALYAGSQFVSTGGGLPTTLAKWNGSSWSAVTGAPDSNDQTLVLALASFNDGSGRGLYVGGNFMPSAGGVGVNNIAKWNGSTWSGLGTGVSSGVSSLTVFDDGSGPAMYAGGYFQSAGGVAMNHIAKWNGSSWSALGSGVSEPGGVRASVVFDDGTGAALYIAGYFTTVGGVAVNNIAKWNGSAWSPLGTGLGNTPTALVVFDDGNGPALYAGGFFTTAGGVIVNSIAKWDGVAWTGLGVGMGGPYPGVNALTVFDDGGGPALYAGGGFSTAGGVTANNIAKWDGVNWSGLGSATTGAPQLPWVRCMSVFDDGSGPALYVGGYFQSVGGVVANSIAKWNGSNWSPLGIGLDTINLLGVPEAGGAGALRVFDDGSGSRLFVMGSFARAGGVACANIAKWNGQSWSPVGNGLSGGQDAGAFEVFDDSGGPALYAGGGFLSAIDSHDSFLAKWGCPFVSSGTTYCTTGTTSNGCVPAISAAGTASATAGSGFTISISNLESHRLGVVFYGVHGQLALPWGVGGTSLLCVKAPTQRLDPYDSGGSAGLCNGLISEDWNLFIATHPSALGQPFLGGETVWAQGWFRDPPSTKTTGLSNGLVFAVAP